MVIEVQFVSPDKDPSARGANCHSNQGRSLTVPVPTGALRSKVSPRFPGPPISVSREVLTSAMKSGRELGGRQHQVVDERLPRFRVLTLREYFFELIHQENHAPLRWSSAQSQ